ncbi:MAG: hypothetical protein JKY00_02730 [Roseicyclus sp.]|nr:hypothetical protein [Roseicyclus sp.]
MVKRVVMHVGLGKTGTRTIQTTLAGNRRSLAQLGVVYPGADLAHHDLLALIHHKGAGHFWYTRRGLDARAAHAAAQRQMSALRAAAATQAPTIILSSEYFQTLRAPQIADFDRQIAALGYQLETLCYIRAPLAHTASRIQQGVKMATARIAQMMDRPYPPLARNHCEAALKALGPARVHLRKMEDARDGLTRDLLWAARTPLPSGAFPDRRQNTGFCHDAVYLLDAINALDADHRPDRPTFRLHQQELRDLTGQKFTLPPDVARRIQAQSRAEQDWLYRNFCLCYPLQGITDVPSHWQEIEWAADTLKEVSRTAHAEPDWPPQQQAQSA